MAFYGHSIPDRFINIEVIYPPSCWRFGISLWVSNQLIGDACIIVNIAVNLRHERSLCLSPWSSSIDSGQCSLLLSAQ